MKWNTRKTKLVLLLLIFSSTILDAQMPSFSWVKTIGDSSIDDAVSVKADAIGNVFTAGYFTKNPDFDPGPGTTNLTSVGGLDIFISKFDASGNFVWAKSFGGISTDNPSCIALDGTSNIYVTGFFNETVDFDPGPGTYTLNALTGSPAMFILKLDANGNFVFAKQIGGSSSTYSEGSSIDLDSNGNIYCCGNFYGAPDFDPGTATTTLTSLGQQDMFILKLNATGNFVYVRQIGSAFDNHVSSIKQSAGNLYLTGSFQSTADFDTGPAIANLTSVSNSDIFVLKMDTSGNFIWVKQIGTSSNNEGWGIAIDATGNVYTTGNFFGTADFDPGPGSFTLSTTPSGAFILKLDGGGNFLWAKQITDANFTLIGRAIALDPVGDPYIIGTFAGTPDFDPGIGTYTITNLGTVTDFDTFVLKLDASGNFGWAFQLGGPSYNWGRDIFVNNTGIYSAGNYMDAVDFDPGPSAYMQSSLVGNRDAFVHKLNYSIPTANKEYNENNGLKIYPNPTSDFFYIESKGKSQVIIFGILGDLVYNEKLLNSKQGISISNLNNGIYFVQIITDDERKVVKLVKE